MLRKRSRPVQNHSSRAELIRARDCDAVAATARAASFFTAPGLFVGLSNKGSSDCDSSMSPTSPLEFRASTLLGSSLTRSTSPQQSPKCWDCRRVGLSLVDSLNHETIPCGKVLRFSGSIAIPKTNLDDDDVDADYHLAPAANSLPKNYSMSSSMTNMFPFSSDAAASSLPLSTKIHNNLKTNHTKLASPLSVEKVSASLPISIGSLSASEIELSEDYTCIISHGSNPKTTHIFGDCILESRSFQSPDRMSRKSEVVEGGPSLRADFLSLCFSCKKKLEEGKDIYIYGGEKAFCSCECRDKEILIEEEMEKHSADISDLGESSTFELEILL